MLKHGATCVRRSAAKIDDAEYLPTGQFGEHHPRDEREWLSERCHVRTTQSRRAVNGDLAASRISIHVFLGACYTHVDSEDRIVTSLSCLEESGLFSFPYHLTGRFRSSRP